MTHAIEIITRNPLRFFAEFVGFTALSLVLWAVAGLAILGAG